MNSVDRQPGKLTDLATATMTAEARRPAHGGPRANGVDRGRAGSMGATAERRLEQQLRERVAHLEAVIETAPDAIIMADEEGCIRSANAATARIFGCDIADILGSPIQRLVPSLVLEARGGTRLSDEEVEGRRRDGEPIALSVAGNELIVGGRRMYTLILRNISQRKRTELELMRYREHLEELVQERTAELEASNERLRHSERLAALGTLAAGLGHDLKNLLFPIQCRLDSVEAVIRSPQARRDVAAIRESLNYLQRLSDGLRVLSTDPNRESPAGQRTNLARWWAEIEPLLGKTIPRAATLEVDLSTALPDVAVARHSLTQAVLNLVTNAGEAVLAGGCIRLSATLRPDGRLIELRVADNGIGMSADVRRRALEPFFTTKKRGLSTGLGLSLVHGVIEAAGGLIDIRPAKGGGTVVTLTLPVAPPEDAVARARPRALVHVDDVRLAGAVGMLLESHGVAVHDADGDERLDDRAEVALLVADDTSDSAAALCRHLKGRPDRLAIRLGAPMSDNADRRVLHADPALGLRTLRAAIGRAAAQLKALCHERLSDDPCALR